MCLLVPIHKILFLCGHGKLSLLKIALDMTICLSFVTVYAD